MAILPVRVSCHGWQRIAWHTTHHDARRTTLATHSGASLDLLLDDFACDFDTPLSPQTAVASLFCHPHLYFLIGFGGATIAHAVHLSTPAAGSPSNTDT